MKPPSNGEPNRLSSYRNSKLQTNKTTLLYIIGLSAAPLVSSGFWGRKVTAKYSETIPRIKSIINMA